MISPVLMRALTGRMSRRRALLLFAEGRLDRLLREVNPWDGRSVQQFVEAAVQVSIAAQAQVVSLTTATQLAYLKDQGVELDFAAEVPDEVRLYNPDRVSVYAKPRVVTVDGERVDRLPVDEVFNRPARDFRRSMKEEGDEAKALAIASDRAKILLRTNVALAEREATRQVLTEARRSSGLVVGYRRIIHPEASESGVCGLCVAASDRMYSIENLKPLHDHCKCDVLPVTKENDPGQELNAQDLERLYDLAGGTSAKKLAKVNFQIEDHGELGPILVPTRGGSIPHFNFANVSDLNAARDGSGSQSDSTAA